MPGSLRLGRIAGIEIAVHYTWIFAFALIVWLLADDLFPSAFPGWRTSVYWTTAVVAAALVFAAVLVHEMAHSLMAKARGMSVGSITLFIFGGVSNINGEASRPRTEFAISIVGPLASLVIASVCWGLWLFGGMKTDPMGALLFYLAYINGMLAAFNLLPGFPLDGGRVLRSIIWGVSGNFTRATRIATTVGRVVAWGLIAYGIFELLKGDFIAGIWTIFIGWFLNSAAGANGREVTMQEHFRGVRVGEIMDPNPEKVSPPTSVSDLVKNIFLHQGRRAAAVVDGERVVGIVTPNDARNLPQDRWLETPVSTIMTREPLYAVNAIDDFKSALKILAEHNLNQVLVMYEGKLVGILSRADVIRHLQVMQELGLHSRATQGQTKT